MAGTCDGVLRCCLGLNFLDRWYGCSVSAVVLSSCWGVVCLAGSLHEFNCGMHVTWKVIEGEYW